jgi:hypothetical protein
LISRHRMTLFAILTTLMMIACNRSNRVDNPPVVPTVNSTPPTVSFEALSHPQAVAIIEGRTSDLEQPISTLLVRIESDQAGTLWSGNPRSDGQFSWSQPLADGSYRLVAGIHQITIRVEDSTDQHIELTKTLEVTTINNSILDDTGDTGNSDTSDTSDTDDTAN